MPILVTNAELWLVESNFQEVSLMTGESPAPPNASKHEFLILKQPFPTPEGIENDFRDSQNPATTVAFWSQVQKESIYVVNATALDRLLEINHRTFLRTEPGES